MQSRVYVLSLRKQKLQRGTRPEKEEEGGGEAAAQQQNNKNNMQRKKVKSQDFDIDDVLSAQISRVPN